MEFGRAEDSIGEIKIVPLNESRYLKPLRAEFEMNGRRRYWDFLNVHDRNKSDRVPPPVSCSEAEWATTNAFPVHLKPYFPCSSQSRVTRPAPSRKLKSDVISDRLLFYYFSVAIVIYNVSRKVLVLVRQFRPAMYLAQVGAMKADSVIDPKTFDLKKGYSLELCAGIVDKSCDLVEIAREEVLEECGYDVPAASLKKIFSFRGVGITGQQNTIFYVEVTDDQKVSEGGGLREEGEFIEVIEMTIPKVKNYISSEDILSPASFVAGIQWFLTANRCT